ncbi:metallophosphoesterase [Palleronia caenipelagi]|uniref:Phosphodiesterase n=1 Tax=Palleronia caenipelagi TaxID=2489174 RepID=A0A547Q8Z1_9RHOB|nr:metallophosphoesterase [Palleronia caenipelagi]TRD22838.1 phosphodiesterase [Palleronia caenipelagi]
MARILHLTDLHLVSNGQHASQVLDTPALVRGAVDQIQKRMDQIGPLDAVLVTGDLTDDGGVDSTALARLELERFRLPLMVVPGNHDARDPLRAVFGDLPGMPKDGLIDWVRDIGDTRIIGLDTLVEGQGGGRLRPESLDHLAHALDGAGSGPVVVALHHPPLRTGICFMDAIALENPGDLATVLAPFKGHLRIVAGHVHGVYQSTLASHPVVTAPSLCSAFALDRRTDAPVGFYAGPTGFAVLDTGPDDLWTAIPLHHGDGIFPF